MIGGDYMSDIEILNSLVNAKITLNNIIVEGFDEKTGWKSENVDGIECVADTLYFLIREIEKNREESEHLHLWDSL